MRVGRAPTAAFATAAMGLLASAVGAGIINVPGDQRTTQQAILSASGGDTVVVAPGT